MPKSEPRSDKTTLKLRAAALSHAHVEEGLACKGTALESATFKVRGKAFLFLEPGRAMVKLDVSRPEAERRAREAPDHFRIGKSGWATVTYGVPVDVPVALLERWIAESYGLFAGGPSTTAKPKKR